MFRLIDLYYYYLVEVVVSLYIFGRSWKEFRDWCFNHMKSNDVVSPVVITWEGIDDQPAVISHVINMGLKTSSACWLELEI